MPKSRPPRANSSDPISRYLTERPYSVPSLATLRHAAGKMAAYGIRHLPVTEGQRVAGLIREGDLHILERCGEMPFDTTTVAEVMCFDVHFIHPFTTLGVVIHAMQRGRFDHAVVLDRERLVGIFTTTDALALFENELGSTVERISVATPA
jgi:acetoin utilization protein AcuB